MPLAPPPHLLMKEAQYFFGTLGSWKSSVWASYGELYRQTDTPGMFHIISTEPERGFVVLEAFPSWPANTRIYEPTDQASLFDVCEQIREVHTEQDWLVIDSIGVVNQWVRNDWFIHNWQENWTDFDGNQKEWIDFKARGNVQKAVQEVGQHNWTRMNNLYERWLREVALGWFKGHRIGIAQSKTLSDQWDPPGKWAHNTFGKTGEKPDGNKADWFLFHSVIHCAKTREGKGVLTTIKDRPGRGDMDKAEVLPLGIGGAGVSYLQAVAGWSVTS